MKVDPGFFVARFESLKKKWFSSDLDPKFDENGEEQPQAMSREMITHMFEQMGVEIPVMPDEPPVPRGQRSQCIGMWWKK